MAKKPVRPICLNCDLARWDTNKETGRVRLYGAHRCGLDPVELAKELRAVWPDGVWEYSLHSSIRNLDSPRTVLRINRKKDDQRDCNRFVPKEPA